jgi:hypothetical protein
MIDRIADIVKDYDEIKLTESEWIKINEEIKKEMLEAKRSLDV